MDCGPPGGMRVENFIVAELNDLGDVWITQSTGTPNGLQSAMQNPTRSVTVSIAFFSNDDLIQNQPTPEDSMKFIIQQIDSEPAAQNPAGQNVTTEQPTPASKIHVSSGTIVTNKRFNAFDSHDADKVRRRDAKKKKKLSHGSQQLTDSVLQR
jgi:hypothetical protein